MEKSVEEQLNIIKDIITRTIPVEQIYLFGSYAYGTPREDSDLDIYVVMRDDAPYRELEALDMVGLALFDIRMKPMDILILKKERFQYRQGSVTLEHEVTRKGVLIYGKPNT
jgi:predicted nucleotidyltransferase